MEAGAAESELDFETEAGVMLYAQSIMLGLRKEFASDGEVDIGMVCLATEHEGRRLSAVSPAVIVLAGDLQKSRSAAIFKSVARRTRAVGVFFYAESWSLDFESDAEHAAWRNRDWGEHPRSKEIVHLSLEHRLFGIHYWRAFITREAGKATLGEFIKLPQVTARGRFTQFLDFPLEA